MRLYLMGAFSVCKVAKRDNLGVLYAQDSHSY